MSKYQVDVVEITESRYVVTADSIEEAVQKYHVSTSRFKDFGGPGLGEIVAKSNVCIREVVAE